MLDRATPKLLKYSSHGMDNFAEHHQELYLDGILETWTKRLWL